LGINGYILKTRHDANDALSESIQNQAISALVIPPKPIDTFDKQTPSLHDRKLMMLMEWVSLILVGVCAGILAGMFGIGGGVVIVPALILIMGFTEVQAISTSLGAILLPVGFLAVRSYYREGYLLVRDAAWVAFGLILTNAIGSLITLQLEATSPELVRQAYGAFLMFMGWRFLAPRKLYAQWRGTYTPEPEGSLDPQTVWWKLFLIGGLAGIASGMFGVGGGAIIVPALGAYLGYHHKLALGISLGALLLPVGLPGALMYYQKGVLDVGVALVVAIGLDRGASIGAKIALRLPSLNLKRYYGIFVLIMGMNFIFDLF
jgi:uncharacterized membrane protein YfcA